jgi:hypothetical protein
MKSFSSPQSKHETPLSPAMSRKSETQQDSGDRERNVCHQKERTDVARAKAKGRGPHFREANNEYCSHLTSWCNTSAPPACASLPQTSRQLGFTGTQWALRPQGHSSPCWAGDVILAACARWTFHLPVPVLSARWELWKVRGPLSHLPPFQLERISGNVRHI